jgi:hypothetical protein
MFLDIIHRPVFIWKHRPVYISKHNVSETGFCLRFQVKPTQLSPIDRASPYLLKVKPTQLGSVDRASPYLLKVKPTQLGPIDRACPYLMKVKPTQLGSIDRASPYLLKTEIESSLRNVVFLSKNRAMDNVQKHNICMTWCVNEAASLSGERYNAVIARDETACSRIFTGSRRCLCIKYIYTSFE